MQGSSKSGYLGEASIDFADFVAETEPLIVTLPLKFANSGVVLHVSLSITLTLTLTLNSRYIHTYIQSITVVVLSIVINKFNVITKNLMHSKILVAGDNSKDAG